MHKALWSRYAGVGLMVLTGVARAEPPPTSRDADVLELQQRLDALQREVTRLQQAPAAVPEPSPPSPRESGQRLIWGGSGALAYFDTGSDGAFPNDEFRIDEARLFLDVRLDETVFLFAETIIEQRESNNQDLRVGEFYVDFEDMTRAWGNSHPLTLRAGRFDIPFGEEYRTRDPIDSPLVSHSIADIWGIDEGVELFGSAGRVDYVLAVQNGGYDSLSDGDPDKSIAARVGYEPGASLRISLSAMRTGDINIRDDEQAELWVGDDYLRPLGAPETTTTFDTELAQADLCWRWDRGHVAAAVGFMRYDDDDTAADNETDAVYYSLEVEQALAGACYAAARYSALHADEGWPVLGQGRYVDDARDQLVDDIWRLGLGLGYRWNPHVRLKTEYTFERGDRTDGASLDDRDQVSVQVAFGY